MKAVHDTALILFVLLPSVMTAAATLDAPDADPDKRTALRLSAEERHLVLSEMRGFVSALDGILDGVAREDMTQIATSARAVGSSAANKVPPTVMVKLPDEFKMFASRVHGGFDVIALDAEAMGDSTHVVEQLSGLVKNCIACHATYQIKTPPQAAR